MDRSSYLFLNIPLMVVLSSFPLTAQAEESPYTPPPLFGGENQTQIIDVIPIPTMPPVADTTHSVPIEKLDTSGNTTLDESASVAVRVPTPVQDRAPINVNVLLDHPANRVAEGAKPLVSEFDDINTAVTVQSTSKKQNRIPDFASYDDADIVAQKEQGEEKKDLSVPAPKATKGSSSIRPQVEKILNEKPEVAVYSRDKKTGEFVKVTGKNTSTGKRTVYRARPVMDDSESFSQSVRSVPPRSANQQKGSTRDVLDALEHHDIPLLELGDLNSGILNVPDTTTVQALPLAARTAAGTEPLAGTPHRNNDLSLVNAPHVLVPFAPGQTEMNNEQKGRIQDNVLGLLQKTPQIHVEIQAYAGQTQQSSDVTRIALGRGLAVRQYLKDNGVSPDQITVRALISSQTGPEADHVDILFR